MSLLSSLLIVAALAGADTQGRHPDTVEVFSCAFDQKWDLNYDGWPDKWQRQLGPDLPHFIPVQVEDDATATTGHALVIHVNGGGACVQSPLFSVSDNFSYKVEARLRVAGVKFAKAQVRIEFCDEEKNVLQSEASDWMGAAKGWVKVNIGPVNPTNDKIQLARIVLYVKSGARADLSGEVALDDVWVARLPKMTVGTNSAFNVYTNKDDIQVTATLSGILDSDPDILFELLDASSQRLGDNRVQLEGRLITERRSKVSEFAETDQSRQAAYAGSTSWRPPISKSGFYKVRVTMQSKHGMLKRDVVNIALVPPLDQPQRGEFGWSLAGHEIPLSLADLAKLLPRVGVNWIKMPVWYGESESSRGDDLVLLAERLAAKEIEVVGVLDRPPADSDLAKHLAHDATIADTLASDVSAWLPLVDPVLTRLSLRVRWWQLGADDDASLGSFAHLEKEVAKLRDKLFRFGQDVNLGFGWKWNQASVDDAGPATWEFQQYSASPALTGQEIADYLDLPPRKGVRRWVLIEPLAKSEYDLETRAQDLVEQMLSAKIQGADAIFAAHPFDDERGLMTLRGMPGELLVPWRTTASALTAAKYLGSIQLPKGSQNRLFETADGSVLMVVWNDEPTEETIHLGDQVKVVDVWGREQIPSEQDNQQVIQVEPLPKFVLGLNPAIARWSMSTEFATLHVPSVFGKSHGNKIQIHNAFPQGVGGTIELVAPKGWQVSPNKIDFKLAAEETAAKSFEVTLPFDANSGDAPIRADFVVDADRQYRFCVYRKLDVGDGEIELETSTRLENDGSLVVEQRMVNHGTSMVDFKCLLYAPGRRRQRMQVFRLGSSPDVKIYRYSDGAQLLGAELWLRAEEVNGSRVLNHRFVVEQ